MTDTEVRIRCIEAAARVPGNPNTIQQARAFYDFVTEGAIKDLEAEVTAIEQRALVAVGKKTSKK